MAFYAQTSGIQSTNSESFVPIPGLSLTIPEGVGTTAIILLNVPFPFSEGSNNPGGTFGMARCRPSSQASLTASRRHRLRDASQRHWSWAFPSPISLRPYGPCGPGSAAAR
jgi:hypothetical protein